MSSYENVVTLLSVVIAIECLCVEILRAMSMIARSRVEMLYTTMSTPGCHARTLFAMIVSECHARTLFAMIVIECHASVKTALHAMTTIGERVAKTTLAFFD